MSEREPTWSDYGVALGLGLLAGPVLACMCLLMAAAALVLTPFLAVARPAHFVDRMLKGKSDD